MSSSVMMWIFRGSIITLASMLGTYAIRACLGPTHVSVGVVVGLPFVLVILMWIGVWIGTLTPRDQ